jgi:hypothetical protein
MLVDLYDKFTKEFKRVVPRADDVKEALKHMNTNRNAIAHPNEELNRAPMMTKISSIHLFIHFSLFLSLSLSLSNFLD